MEKLIINTDIGGDFDDLLALILALNSPELDIKGLITTKEDIRDKAKFAKKLLNEAERKDIRVFYSGQLELKKRNYISVYDYGYLSSDELEKSDQEFSISQRGIEFIIQTIHENPHQINLVSLAPNTNLAEAMKRDPAIIPKIKALYLMGGTFFREDKNRDKPEHNYMKDRRSFHYIVGQKIPAYLVTRDITRDLFLNPKVLEEKAGESEFHQTIYRLSKRFLTYMKRSSLRLSDPITIGSILFPKLYKGKQVQVVTERGKQGDSIYCKPVEKSNITAFYDFDRNEFYRVLAERLSYPI